MKIIDKKENWHIELKNGYYVPICYSPYGGRCLKILDYLKSKDKKETELMFKGYWNFKNK